jgi:hypothetical protein
MLKPVKKRNYLNNHDMLIEIIISKSKNQMTDNLVNMLITLCDRYSKKSNFANYSYIEDMKAYALLNLCKIWASFNTDKSQNPFSYYTQCIKSSFVQFLNQEKKQRHVRDLLLIDQGLDPSHTFLSEYTDEYHGQQIYNDIVDLDEQAAQLEHITQIERLELLERSAHFVDFECIIDAEL